MSHPDPARSPPGRLARLGLSRRALILIGIAFAVGLLLFLMIWIGQRDNDQFYRAGGAVDSKAGQVFEPLPSPDAAGGGEPVAGSDAPAERMNQPPETTGGVIEDSFPDPAPLPLPEGTPPPVRGPSGATSAVPISSPQPRYPADALRRGESGTVLVQVQVDASGAPTAVNVVQSSRSRDLDREAIRTVQRWRFRPATRDGQAVVSKVLIPIDFRP